MNQKSDLGASSAAAFILIIAALVLFAGTWAVVVLPNQIHEEEEVAVQNAINTLIDTKLVMNAAAENDFEDIAVYSHLPKGSLLTGDSGTLFINGEPIQIRSLILETGGTSMGIAGDGVWRKDRDNAAWALFPQSVSDGEMLSFEILTCKETLAYGSSEMIPFSFAYEETRTHQVSGTSILVTFESENKWMEGLWQTFFQELTYQYDLCKSVGDGLLLSAKAGNVTITITEHIYSVRSGGVA